MRKSTPKGNKGSLNAREKAVVQSIRNERWNVMTIYRDNNEIFRRYDAKLYWSRTIWMASKIEPESLEILGETPKLPCGDHVWCGAIAAHQNGNIIKVNGNYMHSISKDCEVIKETKLPIDQAHNGLLILSDGTIVTKDLFRRSRLFNNYKIDQNLDVLHEPMQLPEGSMGRIASDKTEDGEFIFIPGIEKIWKIKVLPKDLEITSDWSPNYRKSNDDQGLSWDGCISDGSLWLMNNGDIDSLRAIYSTHPNGRFKTAPKELSWRRPALGHVSKGFINLI